MSQVNSVQLPQKMQLSNQPSYNAVKIDITNPQVNVPQPCKTQAPQAKTMYGMPQAPMYDMPKKSVYNDKAALPAPVITVKPEAPKVKEVAQAAQTVQPQKVDVKKEEPASPSNKG